MMEARVPQRVFDVLAQPRTQGALIQEVPPHLFDGPKPPDYCKNEKIDCVFTPPNSLDATLGITIDTQVDWEQVCRDIIIEVSPKTKESNQNPDKDPVARKQINNCKEELSKSSAIELSVVGGNITLGGDDDVQGVTRNAFVVVNAVDDGARKAAVDELEKKLGLIVGGIAGLGSLCAGAWFTLRRLLGRKANKGAVGAVHRNEGYMGWITNPARHIGKGDDPHEVALNVMRRNANLEVEYREDGGDIEQIVRARKRVKRSIFVRKDDTGD